MRQGRKSIPLLRTRTKNSLSVGQGLKICSSNAHLMGMKNGDSCNRSMIESMNGGTFLNLTGDLAYKALDKLVDNSQQWDFTSCQDKSA
jgi:hypothetical protein